MAQERLFKDEAAARKVACPHPSEFIKEEMAARGWTITDVAARMGVVPLHDYGMHYLALEMYLTVHDIGLRIGTATAEALGRAFGVSPEFYLNLEAAWRASFLRDEPTPPRGPLAVALHPAQPSQDVAGTSGESLAGLSKEGSETP